MYVVPSNLVSTALITYCYSVCTVRFNYHSTIRRRLHDSVFNTKTNIWSPFWPSVYTQTMKTHIQNEHF